MSTSTDLYPSRQGTKWEMKPRLDPPVWGDPDHGPLARERFESFARDGYLFVDSAVSPKEAAALLEEAHRLADEAGPAREGVIREPESQDVRSVFRVHLKSRLFAELAADPRLADVARQLLGSEVMIHQSRINYKPPFAGKEFYWHSDFETWHVEDGMPRMRAVSLSLNLTESNRHNGPLMVIPGSHHVFVSCVGQTPEEHYKRSLRRQEIGTPDAEALSELMAQRDIASFEGGPGSAVFFECNLLHASNCNLSATPRTNLFLVYNSVENELTDPYGDQPARPEFLAERAAQPLGQG
ncbi:MAG: ectoine hydroxylase [Planctomycetota bacterium]